MYLGIAPGYDGLHHDPSACLTDSDQVHAFVEEERMSRNKHASGEFPIAAIEECLDIASIEFDDIEKIGLSRNYDNRRKGLIRLARRSARSNIGLGEKLWDTILLPIKQTVTLTNKSLQSTVTTHLSNHFSIDKSNIPTIDCINHHRTHALSSFYPSGFNEALIVSLDNYGGHLSGAVYFGSGTDIQQVESYARFNSLGRFYGDITEFLGFQRSNGEGKVMGLAPYGSHNDRVKEVLQSYITSQNGRYNVESLTYRKPKDSIKLLERDLGISSRYRHDNITQYHKDIAFHAQQLLETTVTDLISHHIQNADTSNICLAGGVALNCKLNKKIRELPGIADLFVQPAANDAGGSLGAAFELSENDSQQIVEMEHVYLGSGYSADETVKMLDQLKIKYKRVDNPAKTAAELIQNQQIVGWFQGRMEGGPRALGNRSILADPRTIDSRDDVNEYVKHREEWRPFAPSMLYEEAERYLEGSISKAAYFMIDTYDTTDKAVDDIPAVLHPRDNTTRPQVVTQERNKRYHKLLREFKKQTGIGVVLNTSFNDSGEPIVRTPREAVRDFYSMGLDALIVEDVLLIK